MVKIFGFLIFYMHLECWNWYAELIGLQLLTSRLLHIVRIGYVFESRTRHGKPY